jgi:hypothetical protein
MTGWHAPFTGGYEGILPPGHRFRVCVDPPLGATAVQCDVERYTELHPHFVPLGDRQNSKYTGYALIINFGELKKGSRPDSAIPWNRQ